MTLVPFAEALRPRAGDTPEVATGSGTSLGFDVTDDWLQGRSAFGGLQAAFAVVAMRRLVPAERPLRVLQTTFVGPVPKGELTVRAVVLRAGKSVTHAEARIDVDGAPACVVIGVFGASRESGVAITLPPPVTLPPGPDGLRELPHIPGVVPNFVQHFAMRWGAGVPPFSSGKEASTAIWLRHRTPSGDAEADLVALADAIPSPALSLFKKPAPASSLTWTLEVLEAAPPQGEGWWRMDAEVHAAAGGYVAQTARLHAPDGRVAALARQAVVIFG